MRINELGKHKQLLEAIKYITEAPSEPALKKQAVAAVQSTDDADLLQKVIDTLKAGNIEERIALALAVDDDASKFVEQIADAIMKINAPIEEKDAFLQQYPQGIVNVGTLMDGEPHKFSDIVGGGFNTKLFTYLTTTMASHGVGPGEVALATLSPEISWSGQKQGGGDLQIGDSAVELKTSVKSGGRWINPRKANIDMPGIERAIKEAHDEVYKKYYKQKNNIGIGLPARINPEYWCTKIRPDLAKMPEVLAKCAKTMADCLFSHVNNKRYMDALINGNSATIKSAILAVGFENYKKYSKFDGMLLMDVSSETVQYFTNYDTMWDRIKSDTPYIFAPETEGMPKVTLLGISGSSSGEEVGGEGAPGPEEIAQAADRVQKQAAAKAASGPEELGAAPVQRTARDKTAGMRKLK